MTVITQDPLQMLAQKLQELSYDSVVKSGSCGVMLTTCTRANPKFLVRLQTYLQKHEPEMSIECYFDDQSRMLGIILEGGKLANTHYLSLVCKEFLHRHDLLDGQILVASFPQSGEPTEALFSQFIQTAFAAKGKTNDIKIFVGKMEAGGVRSILVADTEEVSREFLKVKLELKGYEVHEAKDGSEALEKYSQHVPDVVITELNLPVLDGYQLIHRIKEEHEDGKVIVLTEKHLTKDMNRAFELGASDYVTKPFSFSELEWRIKRLQFVY